MKKARELNISPFQSDLLDLSRWAAAFLVVIEHLRSFVFVDYRDAGDLGIGGKIFYFSTGFGHSAVMVFFVMSGFLVGGKVLERLIQGNFHWQKYAVDRFSRLYAVYLLALVLGGVLDSIGYQHFNQFGLYDQSFPGRIAVVNQNFHETLSCPTFLTNLAMCQTILGPVFGSNGPLWSLANEFWYYLAGPLVFLICFGGKSVRRIWLVIVLAGTIWFLPTGILVYALVWLLGAGLYFINNRRLFPFWPALGLFVICFSVGRMQWITAPYVADFLTGISFALVINSCVGNSRRLPANPWHRWAADFSYSVYLCHFPFLVFALSILFQLGWMGYPGHASPTRAGVFVLVLLLTYGWCYLISLATERQTPRVRMALNRLVSQTRFANQ